MRLAEIFVGVRPDARELPADMKRALARSNSDRLGRDEGSKFTKGFSSGLSRLAGAAGAAVAGLAIGRQVKESVTAASDLNETVSKTQQIFGRSAGAIIAFGNKAPTALGQTKQAALDANATFGLFGKTAGLTGGKLVGFTTGLTTLAGDLASFNNTSPEQAIEAIGAALRGESEPIRAYGVLLDDATLKAEAMRLGLVKAKGDTAKIEAAQIRAELAQRKYNEAVKAHGKASTEARTAQAGLISAQNTLKTATAGTTAPLTQQQRVLAAQSVIMRQTTAAQGDFQRTSAGLANQQRIAAAQVNSLKVAIGTALLPVVLQGATALNTKLLPPLIDLATKHGPAVAAALSKITTGAGPAITAFFSDLGPKIKALGDGTSTASPALASLADSGRQLAPVVKDLHASMPSLTDALNVGATAMAFLAGHTDTLRKAMPYLAAAFVAYKVAQAAANVAELASVPIKISTIIANRQLAASNRALIASRISDTVATEAGVVAQLQETSAKNVGMISSIRMRAAIIAQAVAQRTVAAAAKAWTAMQWLLNAALTANPIGIVVLAIGLLVAAFVIAWKHSQTFRTIVTAGFNAMRSVAATAITFVVNHFLDMVQSVLNGAAKAFGWVPGLGPKLRGAATEFGKFRDSVNAKLNGLKDQQVDVTARLKNVTYSVGGVQHTTPLNVIGSAGRGMATGGKVRGYGTPTSDNIPIRVSPTEWVIKGKASAKYGDYAMGSVNKGTATIIPDSQPAGFARGGRPGVRLAPHVPSAHGYNAFAAGVAAGARATVRPAAQAAADKIAADVFASMGEGPAGPPGAVSSFRGKRLNARTIRMLLAAERLLSATFHITQGSYSTSVAASGGTHAGGGVMDTDNAGRPWLTAQNALRRVGFAAWWRHPWQGPWGNHIHSVALGDPTASPAAKNQMAAYRRGGDGLGHGMAAGGRAGDFMSRGFMDRMGIRVYDRGGRWPSGTLGANLSGKTETVVAEGDNGGMRLDDYTIRQLGREFAKAVSGAPIRMDSRRVDAAFAGAAL